MGGPLSILVLVYGTNSLRKYMIRQIYMSLKRRLQDCINVITKLIYMNVTI